MVNKVKIIEHKNLWCQTSFIAIPIHYIWFIWEQALLSRLILGFYCHAIKNKNANHSIRKSRISEMKEDEYTKSLAKNYRSVQYFICEIFGNFTQIFKALYGRRKATETSVFEFPNAWILRLRNSLFSDKECLDGKISPNRCFLIHVRAFMVVS